MSKDTHTCILKWLRVVNEKLKLAPKMSIQGKGNKITKTKATEKSVNVNPTMVRSLPSKLTRCTVHTFQGNHDDVMKTRGRQKIFDPTREKTGWPPFSYSIVRISAGEWEQRGHVDNLDMTEGKNMGYLSCRLIASTPRWGALNNINMLLSTVLVGEGC